jgi:hypothetical protein
MLAEVERALVDQSVRHVSTLVIRRRGATTTLSDPFDLQGGGDGINLG